MSTTSYHVTVRTIHTCNVRHTVQQMVATWSFARVNNFDSYCIDGAFCHVWPGPPTWYVRNLICQVLYSCEFIYSTCMYCTYCTYCIVCAVQSVCFTTWLSHCAYLLLAPCIMASLLSETFKSNSLTELNFETASHLARFSSPIDMS